MAGTAVIGALRVVLGADTAALDKGLSASQIRLAAFAGAVGGIAAGMATEFLKAAKSIGSSVTDVIDHMDKLNKMSQQAGMTTEQLSKLSYAADLADVPLDALGKSVGKLSRALVEAAGDPTSQAARAFNSMGIAVKDAADGSIRPSADIMADIAEKFAGYKDGAEKTALAIALFGKAGAQMIPLLNLGKEGLEEAADEAQRFGLVLDKKTTAAAEAFNDNLTRMDKIKQGVITTMTAKMLPALEALSETLLKSREQSTLWNTVGDVLAGVFNKIAAAAIALITTWQRLFATVADLKTAFDQLKSGDLAGAWETMRKSAADTSGAVVDLATNLKRVVAPNELDKFWEGQTVEISSMNKEVQELGKSWMQVAAPIIAAGTAQKDAVQKFLDAQMKRAAAQTAEADASGKTAAQQAYLKTVYEAQTIALANNIPMTAALATQIALTGQTAAQAAMNLQAAQIQQQAMSPYEKYQQDLVNLQTVYLNTSMSAETFAARQQQLAEAVGATWEQVGSNVAGSFSRLAQAFGKNNKAMGVAAKVFGISQAIINTQIAVTKALATLGPTPLGFAAAAAAVAQGAASVAMIAAQNFAAGGFVSGPGGPTADRIPAMLSNGEFVMNADATERNRGTLEAMNAGADMRAGGARVIELRVPAGQKFWTLDAIRELVSEINAAAGFGVKIEMATA